MTSVNRRYRFCASHRLHSESLSQVQNQQTYGKCNNPFGHGHDYVLDVSITGELDAVTGLVLPVPALDRYVTENVLSEFAHRNLNLDVAEFGRLVPTTENLALVIAERLQAYWNQQFSGSSARLNRISVQETDRNSFEVPLPGNESVIENA